MHLFIYFFLPISPCSITNAITCKIAEMTGALRLVLSMVLKLKNNGLRPIILSSPLLKLD